MQELALNPLDEKFTTIFTPYVSTISFYRGDLAAARRVLADRVGAVVAANPWLGEDITPAGGEASSGTTRLARSSGCPARRRASSHR